MWRNHYYSDGAISNPEVAKWLAITNGHHTCSNKDPLIQFIAKLKFILIWSYVISHWRKALCILFIKMLWGSITVKPTFECTMKFQTSIPTIKIHFCIVLAINFLNSIIIIPLVYPVTDNCCFRSVFQGREQVAMTSHV